MTVSHRFSTLGKLFTIPPRSLPRAQSSALLRAFSHRIAKQSFSHGSLYVLCFVTTYLLSLSRFSDAIRSTRSGMSPLQANVSPRNRAFFSQTASSALSAILLFCYFQCPWYGNFESRSDASCVSWLFSLAAWCKVSFFQPLSYVLCHNLQS